MTRGWSAATEAEGLKVDQTLTKFSKQATAEFFLNLHLLLYIKCAGLQYPSSTFLTRIIKLF
jgi:hypothetical protein